MACIAIGARYVICSRRKKGQKVVAQQRGSPRGVGTGSGVSIRSVGSSNITFIVTHYTQSTGWAKKKAFI